MDRKIYKEIFARLQTLGILNESGIMEAQYMKFISPGLMDLNVDKLDKNTIAIAHNGLQNGDVMADPDVQVWVHPDHKEAEAMTFQNDYLGIYQEVYPEPGKYRPKLKEELNAFLNDWLQNIIEVQKYQLAESEE